MIFVPSRGGVSHSPDEHSSPEQVELGMRVLAGVLRQSLRTE
jgi:acetylornithine deacetylase/succinyl-diaminopimelate desuccinylase-like protein